MKSFRRASRCPCSHTLDSESGHSGSLLGRIKGSKSETDGLLVKDDFQKRFVDRDFFQLLRSLLIAQVSARRCLELNPFETN